MFDRDKMAAALDGMPARRIKEAAASNGGSFLTVDDVRADYEAQLEEARFNYESLEQALIAEQRDRQAAESALEGTYSEEDIDHMLGALRQAARDLLAAWDAAPEYQHEAWLDDGDRRGIRTTEIAEAIGALSNALEGDD